jgi:tetratricopeptide (TPR) repeat protein
MGNVGAAEQGFEAALHLARTLGYRRVEMLAQHGLGLVMCLRGEYGLAQTRLEAALPMAREIGLPYDEAMILIALIRLYTTLGHHAGARRLIEQLQALLERVALPKEARAQGLLACALYAHARGENQQALAYAEKSWPLVTHDEIINRRADAAVDLGHMRAAMEQWADAAAAYQEAITGYQTLGNAAMATEAQAGLAQLALAQGDLAQAQQWVEQILPILTEHPRAGFNTPFFTWLTCYRVLASNEDPRASGVLQTAYSLLQQYAASIQDVALRRMFLEKVAVHDALQQAYEGMQWTPEELTR